MDQQMRRRLAVCGVIGPLFFSVILVVLGFVHPGYSHVTQYMSELGAVNAPYMLYMNILGFMVLGVFLCFFSLSLFSIKQNGFFSLFGPWLVFFSGVCLFFVGFFRCDPDCIPVTIIGWIHGFLALSALGGLIGGMMLMIPRLKADSKWYIFYWVTVVFIVVAVCVGFVYYLQVFDSINGVLQRLSFGVPFLWVVIISVQIYRMARGEVS
ncbi:MAG: DUF998 domain-containing protein [Candidatus Thermoplasmatota archaeon]|nr:DUF998 domain-containing protein [Candidatus Thermoplasmatota archaeon]